MADVTPIAGLPFPESGDSPNVPQDIENLAVALDGRIVPIYSTTGARNTAIPTPTHGQLAYVTGTGELYKYNGSVWVSAVDRIIYKSVAETVTSSATLQNDDHLLASVEASSSYIFDLDILYFCTSTAVDMKMALTFPASSTVHAWLTLTASSTSSAVWDTVSAGAVTSGTTFATAGTTGSFNGVNWKGRITTAGSSGTLQFQWAQNSSSATGLQVFDGSRLRISKVA